MAEKNTNANLCESVAGGSILNVTQDDLLSTNENVNESVDEIVNKIEMVDAKSSKIKNVEVFSLSLIHI